jgi:hypothetical protein
MRQPVQRKIGVLAIEQNFASTTERASSQEVLLKDIFIESCFIESFFTLLKD